MNTFEWLNDSSVEEIYAVMELHKGWSLENDRFAGTPMVFTEPKTANCLGIRENSENDFNNKKYNDWFVLLVNLEDGSTQKIIFECTVDPAYAKDGIAHLQQGFWDSYVIRPHHWEEFDYPVIGVQKRWAICNDRNFVGITRTDGKGNVTLTEKKQAKINIHCRKFYIDPSLGCTVIELLLRYATEFIPAIYDIENDKHKLVNHDLMQYCLINHTRFEEYAGGLDKVERLEAVDGVDETATGIPGGATRSND